MSSHISPSTRADAAMSADMRRISGRLLVLSLLAGGILLALFLVGAGRAEASTLDIDSSVPTISTQEVVDHVTAAAGSAVPVVEPVATPVVENATTVVQEAVSGIGDTVAVTQDTLSDVPVVGAAVIEVTQTVEALPSTKLPAPAAVLPVELPSEPLTLGGSDEPAATDDPLPTGTTALESATPAPASSTEVADGPHTPALRGSASAPSPTSLASTVTVTGADRSPVSDSHRNPATSPATSTAESSSRTRDLRPDLSAVLALAAMLLLALRPRGTPRSTTSPRLLFAESLTRPG